MDLKLNIFGKNNTNKKNDKELIDLDLPYSLYPLFVTSASFEGEVQSDYDIDLNQIIPEYIAKDFDAHKIELSIAKPHVFITYDEEKGIYKYNLVEPPLDLNTFKNYVILISEIERNLLSNAEYVELGKILEELSIKRKDLNVFQGKIGEYKQLSTPFKVALYYVLRNMFGYNIITPLLLYNKVEDISVSGINLPVYVYHREFEYTPTNIIFTKNMRMFNINIDGEEIIDELVLRLISLSNKTISVANPIMDGILPKGDRIAATFRREVSANGSSFVIRRFSESPITILDLINSKVLSPQAAAYLWYAIDMKLSFMVIGVTGAGKTTVLGSILNLVKESMKILTIEDIPELRLAQDNWVQLYARPAYGGMGKEITLMDLLKLALRYRPDIIVVGEIRGEEAYVLFQAISTGHGGATTFHAYDSESAIKRLMNEPLNIPREWIPMMNIIVTVRRLPVYVGDKILLRRRAVAIDEIVSYNDLRRTVRWDPTTDSHIVDYEAMQVLRARTEEAGKNWDEVKAEIERRAEYLKLLASARPIVQSKESYKLLKKYIIKYSLRPVEAMREVQAMVGIKQQTP
ncbi:type II/IV secretion system ATPase subunit [Sulfurisphaera ohwakuensis]|uniref:Flagellar protein FlaI n=1 Tax=Sulfurisphaera ohwakuensis TaxID=69656 RepID=A0A650CF55_SULOH|nr:type II/IV secretion system ATPase subunit [Sulfurisphaera ohwakuensis]MBB5252891.1 flagellar protein FlaI [Sulfurisphaera ohwakuensis]QGR16177.1 type II secretion system protein E [Sulfurisphaera ohwakuensis]